MADAGTDSTQSAKRKRSGSVMRNVTRREPEIRNPEAEAHWAYVEHMAARRDDVLAQPVAKGTEDDERRLTEARERAAKRVGADGRLTRKRLSDAPWQLVNALAKHPDIGPDRATRIANFLRRVAWERYPAARWRNDQYLPSTGAARRRQAQRMALFDKLRRKLGPYAATEKAWSVDLRKRKISLKGHSKEPLEVIVGDEMIRALQALLKRPLRFSRPTGGGPSGGPDIRVLVEMSRNVPKAPDWECRKKRRHPLSANWFASRIRRQSSPANPKE